MRGKNKINLKRTLNGVGIFSSVFLFTAAAIWLYSPTFGTNAAEQSSFRVGASIKSNISIVADSQVVFDSNSASGYSGDTKQVSVRVNTTVEGGYDLYMSSAVENTSLESSTSDFEIKSISSSSYSLSENNWGYKINNSSYYPIPKVSKPDRIKTIENNPVGEESITNITFGVKTASTTTSNAPTEGVYRKSVVFTAVALESFSPTDEDDPSDPDTRTIFDITYMHEMSKKICANTTTPTIEATEYTNTHSTDTSLVPQVILTDARDSKTYLVRKYADGNCWMGQNLEFDFKTSSDGYSYNNTTLTATTLDSQYTDIVSPELLNRSDNAFVQNKFYATQAAFGVVNSTTQNYGWKIGDSRSFSPAGANIANYIVKTGITNAGYYLFEESYSGQPYQNMGNLYSMNAALAGYAVASSDKTIPENSICPKNWQLPEATNNKSIQNLMNVYVPEGSNIRKFNKMVDQPVTMYPTGVFYTTWGSGITGKTQYFVYLHRPQNNGVMSSNIDNTLGGSNITGTAFSMYAFGSEINISNSSGIDTSGGTNGAVRCVAR
jgi:hypothetical protein